MIKSQQSLKRGQLFHTFSNHFVHEAASFYLQCTASQFHLNGGDSTGEDVIAFGLTFASLAGFGLSLRIGKVSAELQSPRSCFIELLEARRLLAADVRVELRIDHAEHIPGSDVHYELLVTNDGPDDAIGLVQHDPSAFLEDVLWQRETHHKRRFDRQDLEQNAFGTIDGSGEEVTFGRRITRAGDVNGDGVDDVIVGWSAGTWGGNRSTRAYVVFGRDSTNVAFERIVVEELNGDNGFQLDGGNDGITSFNAAGDVNGDGIDDIIVGASLANDRNGITFIVFGRDKSFPAQVRLNDLDGNDGFAVHGDPVQVGDEDHQVYAAGSGFSVSGAGDFNGDGLDDVLIGSSGWYGASAAYVVFGSRSRFPAHQQLKDLDGQKGVRLFRGDGANTAQSVAAAGDVNGDGMDDIIVGSYGGDVEAFVIFGSTNMRSKGRDLKAIRTGDGFVFRAPFHGYNQGGLFNDAYGATVNGVGDVNGDGFGDVIIGAPRTTVNGRVDSGAAYVVFGAGAISRELNAEQLDGSNGFVTSGRQSRTRIGIAVEPAGDINGDGLADVVVQSTVPGSRIRDYGAYVLFGQHDFEAHVELSALDGRQGFFLERAVRAHSPGDLNHDGVDDLFAGFEENTVLMLAGGDPVNPRPFTGGGPIRDSTPLPAGTTATYRVSGRVSEALLEDAGIVASVRDDNAIDPEPANNRAFKSIPTIRGVDLVVSSKTSTLDVVPGDPTNFDFTISNKGSTESVTTQVASSLDEIFSSFSWTRTVTQAAPEYPASFDIANLDGTNGYEIRLGEGEDSLRPVELGDFNGDGLADFALASSRADASGADSGAVFIVFGSKHRSQPSYGPPWLGREGVLVVGSAEEELGRWISGVGDINGDGLDDLIVGGDDHDLAYALMGTREPDWVVTTSAFEPRHGFRIRYGAHRGRSGWRVEQVGNLNGDAFDDFFVSGSVWLNEDEFESVRYVVFGREQFGEDLDLSRLTEDEGFALDDTSYAIGRVGDVTADGIDDLAFHSTIWPNPLYLLPGRRDGFPAKVADADIVELGGFRVSRPPTFQTFADSVGAAGDVNGDGIQDMVIGSHGSVPSDRTTGGLAVLLGADGAQTDPPLSLVSLDDSSTGRSVKGIGDLNADGIDDMLVDGSVSAYVVFGSRAIQEFDFTFAELDGVRGFSIRNDQSIRTARSIGDTNGDGFGDVLFGGRGIAWIFYGPTVSEQTTRTGSLQETLDVGVGTTVSYSVSGIVRRDLSGDVAAAITVSPDSSRTDRNPTNNQLTLTFEVIPVIDGDVNANGRVDWGDFLIISSNFGSTVTSRREGDLDGDGRVQFADFLLVSDNFGRHQANLP